MPLVKHIALLCDGTWQRLSQPCPTNVARAAELISRAAGTASDASPKQVIYYDEGLGIRGGGACVARLAGGALGAGLDGKILEAYEFLILNYQPADRVFVFGYSRGAYIARSLVGVLHRVGLLRAEHASRGEEALKLYRRGSEPKRQAFFANFCQPAAAVPRPDVTGTTLAPRIAYAGVWDTVGALGLPSLGLFSSLLATRYRFHDTKLSPAVASARHAAAANEERRVFKSTHWSNLDQLNACSPPVADAVEPPYQQKLFPGSHGDVGGGCGATGLWLDPFEWVLAGAENAGLRLAGAPAR